MDDIRVNTDFPNHRKTKKLIHKLGFAGPTHLLFLWATTAKSRPKGILTGMDVADIALDAQWPGDPQKFVDALIYAGFIEVDSESNYCLHDWKDHQPWAFFADERSEKARQNVMKRWEKKAGRKRKEYKSNTDGIQPEYERDTPSPSPNPSPNPNPIPTQIPPLKEWVIEYCKSRNNGVNPDAWFDHYQSNGWKVGKAKNPMKDWQATIRTWEHNKQTAPPPVDPIARALERMHS